ncbi:hypothetical protein EDD18DRAFT_1366945 [Armillaria luteobubalina]|uniref:Uncharacterized protein n=1 Tax=Armillaria luteobubalina TaxID=153913 RepID=A0AA39P161_9AGAR|nr:hypothetical protein EDD18DRAFT_1366945 [Armillaria luteobubalina]
MAVTFTKSEVPGGIKNLWIASSLPELELCEKHTRLIKGLFALDFFNSMVVIFTLHMTNIWDRDQESPMKAQYIGVAHYKEYLPINQYFESLV